MPDMCLLTPECSPGPSPSEGNGGAGGDSKENSRDDQRPGMALVLEELGWLERAA